MRSSLSLVLVGALAGQALAQFVPPPKDLKTVQGHAGVQVRYKEVPTGICELDPTVKSYSGFADIEKDQHIFFWFFEARNIDPKEAPLTVWINGGPGAPSMLGLFQELGPCGIDFFGNAFNNPYSWSNVSNMLFIDQPAQVGFSYTVPVPAYVDPNTGDIVGLPDETCPDIAAGTCGTFSEPNEAVPANTTESAAPGMWKTIQGFMGAFPQYSRGGFHFGSESFGGHYAPIFNEYFEEQNKKDIPGAVKIRLESVMIGNGVFNPFIQFESYYNFMSLQGNTYGLDPFSAEMKQSINNSLFGPGNCFDQIKNCEKTGEVDVCVAADNFCINHVQVLFDQVTGRFEDDIRYLSPDPFPYMFYSDYLSRADVLEAIGAVTNFSDSVVSINNAFFDGGRLVREIQTIPDLKKLLHQGVNVCLYSGDADYIANWLGVEAVADAIGAENWDKAGYVNMTTSDGKVNGQVKQAGKLSFARVYEAGHEVPFYQPLLALEMFERVINNKDIATGQVALADTYITKGTPKSTFQEGNGTVQTKKIGIKRTYDTNTHKPGPLWTKIEEHQN